MLAAAALLAASASHAASWEVAAAAGDQGPLAGAWETAVTDVVFAARCWGFTWRVMSAVGMGRVAVPAAVIVMEWALMVAVAAVLLLCVGVMWRTAPHSKR